MLTGVRRFWRELETTYTPASPKQTGAGELYAAFGPVNGESPLAGEALTNEFSRYHKGAKLTIEA